MQDSQKPFVAIVGGLWQLDEKDVVRAKQIGEAVGKELAKAGFGLVVYFSNEESLEPHIVSGYVSQVKDGQNLVRVRYAASLRGKINFKEEASRPELFDHVLFPGDDWEVPFYQSLANEEGLDAVLLLAGSTSTLIAGQIALARRLPILAIDALGGAASKIWSQLAYSNADNFKNAWGTRPIGDFISHLKQQCIRASDDRADKRMREAMITQILSRRNQGVYLSVSLATLFFALALGTTFVRINEYYAIVTFFGLIAAGAVGASVRTILAEGGSADPRISVLLGSVAGLIVGLAYLVPQWVGAPGSLAPIQGSVSANDRIQFISSVLVATSAGVGFDTIFNRLRKQAEDSAVAPPKP